MHQGSFPPTSVASTRDYRRGRWQPTDLEPTASPGLDRRQWLFSAAGVVLGAGAALGWTGLRGGAVAAGAPGAPAPAARPAEEPLRPGTLPWALSMVDAPFDELVKWSGDLDRVSMRHRDDPRLVPCFERLLEGVLERRAEHVDAAGACAVRSLARMGRTDVIEVHLRGILARKHLQETRAAAEEALPRFFTERRTGGK